MENNQNNIQDQPAPKRVESQPKPRANASSSQLKLPAISFNVITLICDAVTMFFIFALKLFRMTDVSVTTLRVFSWLAGIALIIGLVFYAIKLVFERKFTITPTLILQMFITYIYFMM